MNQTEKGNECGALWGKRSKKKRKEKCIYMQKTENDGSLSIYTLNYVLGLVFLREEVLELKDDLITYCHFITIFCM